MKNKFKTMGLLMCFVATFMMVSCNKEEANEAKIVGTWGCVHSYAHIWGENFDNEYTDYDRGNVVNFKEDGSYTSSIEWLFFDKEGTWMIDGNSLFLDRHAGEIQNLSNNALKLYYEEHYDNRHGEWTLEFKRQ